MRMYRTLDGCMRVKIKLYPISFSLFTNVLPINPAPPVTIILGEGSVWVKKVQLNVLLDTKSRFAPMMASDRAIIVISKTRLIPYRRREFCSDYFTPDACLRNLTTRLGLWGISS